MKYFSMFSGIGGFERGINEAYLYKHEPKNTKQTNSASRRLGDTDERGVCVLSTDNAPLCVGYSEIDKYAIQIYEKHFKGHKNYGNARNIVWEQVPDFDLLVGGFPCQAFSIAGKRGGFEDTRGTLFFEIARALAAKRPKLCLLENVRGLLSHDKGKTFGTILATLSGLGYFLEWQVLNSKDFGVPQNRERVFIVGHLGGRSGRTVFPIECSNGQDIKVAGYLNEKGWDKRHEQIRRIHDTDGISPTIPTGTGGGVMTKIMADAKIRRLTPTECERLQGFPDGWTEGVSDTQRYKCLGNAVTVNVIQAIATKLFRLEKG